MRTSLLAAALAVIAASWPAPADAQNARAVRKTAEATMRLSGMISIAADGSVSGYTIDRKDQVSPEALELMAQTVPHWRFQPVLIDGTPTHIKTSMQLRLQARPEGDGNYRLSVAGTHFGEQSGRGDAERSGQRRDTLEGEKLDPPFYPQALIRAGGGGTAYALVRIGRDGRLEDVHIEQVNLDFVAPERDMARARELLAASAMQGARRWTFQVPVEGKHADRPYWVARVPVNYCMDNRPCRGNAYAKWESYIPGPRALPPAWASEALRTAGAPDSLPSSGVFPLDEAGPRLLTPVGG